MARGNQRDLLALLGTLAAGIVFVYLVTGRGRTDSRMIPDRLEDALDRLVESLNSTFGTRWVDVGLDALQAHIGRTMPHLATLVTLVHRVEQRYRWPSAGAAKRSAVLRAA